MDPMNSQHVAGFHNALDRWTDSRFISRQDIESLAMFSMYLVNLLEARGVEYYGFSWKESPRMGCLVVKITREGTPQVVFTNARTYAASVRIFLRRLQEDVLDWRPDRYRQ